MPTDRQTEQGSGASVSTSGLSPNSSSTPARQVEKADKRGFKETTRTVLRLEFQGPQGASGVTGAEPSTNAPPVLFHVAGTQKIVVDLTSKNQGGQVFNLRTPDVPVKDPLVVSVVGKSMGARARMLIETRRPVRFSAVLNGGQWLVILEPSDRYQNGSDPALYDRGSQ